MTRCPETRCLEDNPASCWIVATSVRRVACFGGPGDPGGLVGDVDLAFQTAPGVTPRAGGDAGRRSCFRMRASACVSMSDRARRPAASTSSAVRGVLLVRQHSEQPGDPLRSPVATLKVTDPHAPAFRRRPVMLEHVLEMLGLNRPMVGNHGLQHCPTSNDREVFCEQSFLLAPDQRRQDRDRRVLDLRLHPAAIAARLANALHLPVPNGPCLEAAAIGLAVQVFNRHAHFRPSCRAARAEAGASSGT